MTGTGIIVGVDLKIRLNKQPDGVSCIEKVRYVEKSNFQNIGIEGTLPSDPLVRPRVGFSCWHWTKALAYRISVSYRLALFDYQYCFESFFFFVLSVSYRLVFFPPRLSVSYRLAFFYYRYRNGSFFLLFIGIVSISFFSPPFIGIVPISFFCLWVSHRLLNFVCRHRIEYL